MKPIRIAQKYRIVAGSNSGNVLFLILIAVALFAALSYVVIQSSRGNSSSLSREKSDLYAAQIAGASASYTMALQRLVLNGCERLQIDFYTEANRDGDGNPIGDPNPNSPPDGRCSLFHPKGGGVSPFILPKEALGAVGYDYGAMNFYSEPIKNVGITDDEDISPDFSIVYYVNRQVCLSINDADNVKNPGGQPPELTWDSDDAVTSAGGEVDGHSFFCGKTEDGDYIAYSVLSPDTPGLRSPWFWNSS